MADVLDTQTGQLLTSVHTPDYEGQARYIIHPTQEDIDANPPPEPTLEPIPNDGRLEVYSELANLWPLATLPADFAEARLQLKNWLAEVSTNTAKLSRLETISDIQALRLQMEARKWPWAETDGPGSFLRWVSEQG